MANPVITNNELDSSILKNAQVQNDTITFAGADVLAPGTILARAITSGKLIIYVKGGVADGNGVPSVILLHEVTATGAGDLPARVGISGEYRKERLIIDADGDDSNIDAAVKDLLREISLIPVNVKLLGIFDNQ